VTDTIDPPLSAPPVGEGDAPPDAEPPEASRVLPVVLLAALVVVVVRFFGFWGLFVVLGLIASIVLHELGHYLTAKQAGMKVTEFFIGFGPKIWSYTRGETTYGIKPLPLGAYVRIIGMNDLEDIEPGDEGRTYREKSYWARLRVVLAGPCMNFLIGFLLLVVLFAGFGQATKDGWTVQHAEAGTSAAAIGLQKGDRLVSLDGQKVTDFDTFGHAIEGKGGQQIELGVIRDGHAMVLTPTVGWILNAKGAADLGSVQQGDQILAVDGHAVATYDDLRQALRQAPKGTAKVLLLRGGWQYHTTVTTPQTLPTKGSQGFLGIEAGFSNVRQGPVQAVGTAGHQFATLVGGSTQALGHFFSPAGLTNWTHTVLNNGAATPTSTATQAAVVPVKKDAPPAEDAVAQSSASSPDNNRLLSIFGVLRLGSEAGSAGAATVIFLLALINIFLGLLNLVPLPPFDGGHAAVATYEAIREKISGHPYRADMAKLIPVTYAVLVLMGFIFLSSSYLDLLHPAKNPFGP
jgi:RIP metalloprotease RseP